MNRLPKKRGITQDGEDKSLILRQNLGNPPKVTSDENSSAELSDSLTIPDVLVNKVLLSKITTKNANKHPTGHSLI
jgi:hypothetical protein